jgi:hypothetical protein
VLSFITTIGTTEPRMDFSAWRVADFGTSPPRALRGAHSVNSEGASAANSMKFEML